MKKQTKLQRLKNFLTELNKNNCKEIDLAYYADEDQESFEDLRDAIESSGGFDIEIIYYGSAMEYLSNNDSSLKESLGLAADMGFDVKSLNSETLASLLATQNEREEFESLENEIEAFFEELNEENDSEE